MNTWGQLLVLLASVGTGRAAAVRALLAQPWGQETSHLWGGRGLGTQTTQAHRPEGELHGVLQPLGSMTTAHDE